MRHIFRRAAKVCARALLARLDIERYYEIRDVNVQISGSEYPVFKNRLRSVCVGRFSRDKFCSDGVGEDDFLTVAILEVQNEKAGTKDANLVYLSEDRLLAIAEAYSADKPAELRNGGTPLNDLFDSNINDAGEMIIAHVNAKTLVKAANAYLSIIGSPKQAVIADDTVILNFTTPEA